MANISEKDEWVDGIYQLETTDPVMGGPDGIDNLQAKQLANRTQYLKSLYLKLHNIFQPMGEEAVIFSPNRKYHAVMRNDGVFGVYNEETKKVEWCFGPQGSLIDGLINSDKVEGLEDFYKKTNDSLDSLLDRFQAFPYESVVFSPDKRYHSVVRNDGIFGFFDQKSPTGDLIWCVGQDGGLIHGYVNPDKVKGLEDFYKKTNDSLDSLLDRFQSSPLESVIFSQNKKYHAVMRNDGVFGVYNEETKKVEWCFGPQGNLIDGLINPDKVNGLATFITNTNNNITNTNNNVTYINNKLSNLEDKFTPLPYESVVFSPNKKFHSTVRNDGVFGFYDQDSPNQDLSWCVGRDGGLIHGYVNVDKIRGLEDLINSFIPVGVAIPWPKVTPPDGWTSCNGWRIDAVKNPRLAAAYPSGYLPDLRGEFIRGLDCGRGVDPNREILSFQPDAIRNFTGSFAFESNIGGNSGGAIIDGVFYAVPDSTRTHLASSTGGTNTIVKMDVSRGTPTSHDIHPRSVAYLYIVKLA